MRFKVLKHKTLPDTFGSLVNHDEGEIRDADTEIYHTSIPDLLRMETTMELLRNVNNWKAAHDQLNDYELIEVELTIK